MISPSLQTSGPSANGRLFQCADCSAEDPKWASLNRGVLICSECCYVHRNLGRHVSHVRSLQKGTWCGKQLELMYTLYSSGSNSIWEHTLLDPQTSGKCRKKPLPSDPVLPIKEAFIKEKYAQGAFTLRPSKDDAPLNQEDLDRQLWSCVRTSHVITTLRLLALGADPNYADPEKQNAALHIAAKEGQALQVELLWLYGADAGQLNASDLTPSQIAKLENNNELATRLEDLRFEVTSRLTMFLCGRRPDHSRKQYFLVPDLLNEGPITSQVAELRHRLIVVSPSCFERIVQDVYDEVDRRETVAAWNAVMREVQPIHLGNELCVAVFLPPIHEMTATRNQLRQKLAKCGVREFATLIVDILKEAKRRHFGLPPEPEMICTEVRAEKVGAKGRNDDILDSMARDYDDVADSNPSTSRTSGSLRRSPSRKNDALDEVPSQTGTVPLDDFLELKERVVEAEEKLCSAQKTNEQLVKLFQRLQGDFDRLTADNMDLRNNLNILRNGCTEVLKKSTSNTALPSGSSAPMRVMTRHESVSGYTNTPKAGMRSRFESDPAVDRIGYDDSFVRVDKSTSNCSPEVQSSSRGPHRDSIRLSRTSLYQKGFDDLAFPDNLIRETERLTIAIRLLLSDAQMKQLPLRAPDHAHSIAVQVDRIMAAVPVLKCTPEVKLCLQRISDDTVRLSAKCNAPSLDAEDTCSAAYAVAKAAKNLLLAVHEI